VKEDSIAFISTDKLENPPPSRVIEKFPREQFEAFAALLEFRRRSETFRHVCRVQVAYYTVRNAFDYEVARTHRQNHELPHDRVAEVAEFVESLTDREHSNRSIVTRHSAIKQINTRENRC